MKNIRRTPEPEPTSHPDMLEVYKIRNSADLSCLHMPNVSATNSKPAKDANKPVTVRSAEMIAYLIRAGY